jgi:hypothetical protein
MLRAYNKALPAGNAFIHVYNSFSALKTNCFDRAIPDALIAVFAVIAH